MSASVCDGLDFLQELLDSNVRGYSAMCTARSALSTVLYVKIDNSGGYVKFADHPFVKQFMKGVSNIKPVDCKYTEIWNPDVVLRMFKLPEWNLLEISDVMLVKKVVMLILLATDQRGQIILALRKSAMMISDKEIVFKVTNADLKQGRRGYKPQLIRMNRFSDQDLCPVRHIEEYLKRTDCLRGNEDRIFLISRKPFNPVSRDTVSRWTLDILKCAKIDTECFSAGSTRSAAGSKASRKGVPLDVILSKGGWTQESTFAKFYNKKLQVQNFGNSFSDNILAVDM